MQRRELLAVVSGSTAAIAGCVDGLRTSLPDELPGDGDADPDENDAPAGDAVRWTYRTGGTVRHQPALHHGRVYAGGGRNDNASTDRDHVDPATSENVYALSADAGEAEWTYQSAAGIGSSPMVSEGVFVVVGWNAGTHGIGQRLVRIDGGDETWTTRKTDRFLHLLDISDGAAYVGTSDDEFGFSGEQLIAVHASQGEEHWAIDAGDTTDAAIYDDTLFAVEGGRRTTAFDTSDGDERWHQDMRPGTDTPRVVGQDMYLAAQQQDPQGNYPVVAVRVSDGAERWRFSVPVDEPFVPTGAVPGEDAVYVTEYDGWLFSVDQADGTERWRYHAESETRDEPVIADDMVYVASKDGRVHAVDRATGDQQWTSSVPGQPRIVAGNTHGVIVHGGSDEGTQLLRAYAPNGSTKWDFSHDGSVTRPAVNGARAFLGTKSGYVVALGSD